MIALLASVGSAVVLLAGLGAIPGVAAADSPYKVDTRDNIVKSASALAKELIALYDGNKEGKVPGLLPGGLPPRGNYFWWQGSALMSTYIDYYHLTGDDTYNDIVTQGMLHQAGSNNDYMPFNVTAQIGNDDQCIWGLSALLAAENKFPNPPNDKPQWIDLAKNAFEALASPDRHDGTCGGGLRWMIPPTNVGYSLKDSITNGCYLNFAARLARYTGNDTYADIAADTWDWLDKTKLIDEETYAVYYGAQVDENCTEVNDVQLSISSAYLLQGAAFMFNHTNGDSVWRERLTKLTNATLKTFFPDDAANEPHCEDQQRCNSDEITYKGLLHRWLASATQVAPFLADAIRPVLKKSTEGAVKTCTGGLSGHDCGFYDWAKGRYITPNAGEYHDVWNVGEQMNVLAAVQSLLVGEAAVPVTEGGAGGGGSNGGDNNASGTSSAPGSGKTSAAKNAAGRSGAQIVSAVVVGLGACVWLVGA